MRQHSSSTLFLLVLVAFLGSTCKEGSSDLLIDEDAFYEATQIMVEARSVFADNVSNDEGDVFIDAYHALKATTDWLESQAAVRSVQIDDSVYARIEFEAGVRTSFWLDFVDDNANSIFRGGASVNTAQFGAASSGEGPCSQVIENQKILVYAAAAKAFGYDALSLQELIGPLEDGDIGFEVDILQDGACKEDAFARMGEYGLVLMITHGQPEGTMIGPKIELDQSKNTLFSEISTKLGAGSLSRFLSGDLYLSYGTPIRLEGGWFADYTSLDTGAYDVFVSSQYLGKLPKVPNTIVVNNSCYGGWTTPTEKAPSPIGLAYRGMNPAAYFSWVQEKANDSTSQYIDNNRCKLAEANLLSRVNASDSTGLIHLKPDGTLFENDVLRPKERPAAVFKQWRSKRHCFSGECEITSFTDPRDGNVYPTVCIGDDIWMAENLRYAVGGVCFEGISSNCEQFGRFYTIEELTNLESSDGLNDVQGLCPPGWHVPNRYEFDRMVDALGGEFEAGPKLAANSPLWTATGTNSSGFGLLPHGFGIDTNDAQGWIDNLADNPIGYLWTSTERLVPLGPQDFTFFTMGSFGGEFFPGFGTGWLGQPNFFYQLPCRCVKD